MPTHDDVVSELTAMLDEGIDLDLSNPSAGAFVLHVQVHEGCEDCLVPDEVMSQLVSDALSRRGVQTTEVTIVHT